MDANRFDSLTKTLSAVGTRRGLMRLLAATPLAGLLMPLLGDEHGDAKRRASRGTGNAKRKSNNRGKVGTDNHKHEHRRRKHRNKRNNGHKGKPKKKCTPQSLAQTCDGQCGPVKNNCQKTVDCGSCECSPACTTCLRCDAESRECVPDPAQLGERCGDGLVCLEEGRCACQGNSCGGCRACEGGACVPDPSVVCEPSDQCHEAGECDPATEACTNPRKADDTPCDDDDPCTVDDVCQNGECRGTPKDCSSEGDVCHDGVCRADGTCGQRPKQDGTGCNADNTDCTEGDSCQDGVCTPGAGIDCRGEDDQCNRGVCRTSDGQCIKEPRPDGTSCGSKGECVNGACEEVVCLALREPCNPNDNQCCDAACATSSNCLQTGDRCCHRPQESCSDECECCGNGICEGDKCCHHTQGSCQTAQDCCQNFLNRQACQDNRCCALPDEQCEAEGDCCEGICDLENLVCVGCLSLQQLCEDENQCCQSGGPTECGFSFDFDTSNCCRPLGGACDETNDCCDGVACSNNRCCAAEHAVCQADNECCPGFECRAGATEQATKRCRPAFCREPGESCDPAQPNCCPDGVTACTTIGSSSTCCRPSGAACQQIPGQSSPCCGDHRICDQELHSGVCCVPDFQFLGLPVRTCEANDDCCSGYCHTPKGTCCRTEGQPCHGPGTGPFSECCPFLGLTCSGQNGSCIPCRKVGQSCTEGTCCVGSGCVDGVCRQDQCSTGQFCQEDSVCCPGYTCAVEAATCFRTCMVAGESCGSVFPCCGNLTCSGGNGEPLICR
jgi:hypothetical protein